LFNLGTNIYRRILVLGTFVSGKVKTLTFKQSKYTYTSAGLRYCRRYFQLFTTKNLTGDGPFLFFGGTTR
jgi:hypothetical protein